MSLAAHAQDRTAFTRVLKRNPAVRGALKEARDTARVRKCDDVEFVQFSKTAFRVRIDCGKADAKGSVQVEVVGLLDGPDDLRLDRITFNYVR